MPDYIVCTRAIKGGSFSSEPGPTRFLKDLTYTLAGDMDHNVILTRVTTPTLSLAEK